MLNPMRTFILLLTITVSFPALQSQEWTGFRGGDLHALAEGVGYPTEWNDSTNIVWKLPIEGKGWSSPIVKYGVVWVTTAIEKERDLILVGIDFEEGKIIHQIKLFRPDEFHNIHALNSYATPTSCVDDKYVYVNFGRYGTACVRISDLHVMWKREDLICDHFQGPGASPILYKDKLILHFEGMDAQYIVALDKNTGKTIWRIDRDEKIYSTLPEMERKAYVTPIVINVADRDLLISNGSAGCFAYDVKNGEEVWRIVKGITSTVSMPTYWNGNLYFFGGLVNKEDDKKHYHLTAADPKGKGDISKTNIIWVQDYSTSQMLTPVVNKEVLYTMDTRGNMQGIDAFTGEIYWAKRFIGKFNSSPICAGGFVYFNSNRGETVVIKEGKELNIVSENLVEGQIWATPAFVNGSILLRISEYLYKVGL